MNLNRRKECYKCNIDIIENRKNFRSNIIHGKEVFHLTCRKCEDEIKRKPETLNGLLLCHKCGEYFDKKLFTSNSTKNLSRSYRRYICNDCNNKRQISNDTNLSDEKKLLKTLKLRLLGARDRSIKSNIYFDLDIDFLIYLWKKQNGTCAVSGVKMTFELKSGRVNTNLSIDRICSNIGYNKNNVQLTCMAVNQMKSDMDINELYVFCNKIVKNYEGKNIKGSE